MFLWLWGRKRFKHNTKYTKYGKERKSMMIKISNFGHQKTPLREWKGKPEWDKIYAEDLFMKYITNSLQIIIRKHRQTN